MMLAVRQHQEARRDLIRHFVDLAENAGIAVAERFLAGARASFQVLAQRASIGVLLALNNAALAGMRKW
ncbi:hypothetical protein V8J88_09685 [Massilia sp. W12]|uniref:hypothetical protein n=1 Tax=Massilia sp. W12 TaxID=3126507 RepID=UPI0030CC6270